jgi:amino acid adenylation domain-containing protein
MADVFAQRSATLASSEDTIVSRFELQVAAAPDKLAIVTDEISLSYRALDVKATRIAAALASRSSERDQPIVLLMKDDAARLAAMLGVLKADRIFIPLAPDSPKKWLTQVINDSGACQVIVDSSTRSVAEAAVTDNVTVIEVGKLARSLEPFVANRAASADDTAYIVYTSGSTGGPKGVANSHRNLIRRSEVRYSLFGLGRDDRYANLRSIGFAVGINETWLPLLSGGCLFPFDLNRHGLHKLARWLIAQKITYIAFSGSLLRSWLALLPDDLRFPTLRLVWASSERLYADDVIRVSRHLEGGDWGIGYTYASTECGTITAQVFTPSRLPNSGIVSVGHPVEGMEVCIKDESGALVPAGEIGEIVVRSRFLVQGYWNDPELTGKAFQTDPFDSAVRSYCTGDLGRWRSDGMLEHMGRKGRRIRLRGYSIEPFHVECELMRQPGVTDAVVLLNDGSSGHEPFLVGYIVAPANTSPSAVQKSLAERLPSYMVPPHIVVLDKFPIASSGKIDYKKFPRPDLIDARSAAFRAPSDDREHQLLGIWQEVLKIPKIGIDDNFFELGGTSLQALMAFAKIETRLGCSVSPAALVQAPTIASLAELIRATTGVAASQSLVPLRVSEKGLPLFLVHNAYCYLVYYRHLLSELKSDRPVYGLQPLPLDGKHRIPRTIESMAADYVTEIRRIQPRGPYFIAGHSFGGLVSFEIAQQLVHAGQQVSFLGLIDTLLHDAPAEPDSPVSAAAPFSHRIYDHFSKLRWTKDAALKRWYSFRLQSGHSIPYAQRPLCYDRICRLATRGYEPKPYPGHITMFSSAGNSERQKQSWKPLANGGLTVLEVPAGHDDMVLPPFSKLLAEHFDGRLDAVVEANKLSPAVAEPAFG